MSCWQLLCVLRSSVRVHSRCSQCRKALKTPTCTCTCCAVQAPRRNKGGGSCTRATIKQIQCTHTLISHSAGAMVRVRPQNGRQRLQHTQALWQHTRVATRTHTHTHTSILPATTPATSQLKSSNANKHCTRHPPFSPHHSNPSLHTRKSSV